jgi:fructose-1,6-bisphosphatase/inositol monophosphatase family enzyme
MKFRNFEAGGTEPELFRKVREAKDASRDTLESIAKGFPFPVHEKVRDIPPDLVVKISDEDERGLSKLALIQTILHSLKAAWEQGIEPRIGDVRGRPPESMKVGTDFFTEADTASEAIIRDFFINSFGKGRLRIFGEEANAYLGNRDSRVGIRIDPIDGTESMKFGKPDWGIMIGIYEGTPENEKQMASAVYYPERQLLVHGVGDVGVFITDLGTGQVKETQTVLSQDDIKNMIIQVWKHTDVRQRGKILEIEKALAEKKARIRTTASSCGDVLEALLTNGQRAMIIDGDFNQVDFIPFALLEQVGYTLYDWKGKRVRADDAELTNKKIVAVPPGQAGKEIIEITKRFSGVSSKKHVK